MNPVPPADIPVALDRSQQTEPITTVVLSTLEECLAFILQHIGATTLVAIEPDTDNIAACWFEHAQVALWVKAKNDAGWNVYFQANRPQKGLSKKAQKADIHELLGLYADIDAKNGRTMDGCLAAIEHLPILPSFIIMTGGGYQPFWLFDQPIPASPESIAWAEATGRNIAALTQGDPVENIDRILRLPGTINYPNERKKRIGRTLCMASVMVRQ